MSLGGAERPTTVLVSAIGGEGGGVLAGWIVAAAKHAGYPVQSTSIPGVAQRTGATTYYLEVFPIPITQLGDKRPVLAIYPGVGDVDIMIASEFIEAGRAISNGFITPDRTVLIGSTHRVFAMGEKSALGDGRHDTDTLHDVIAKRAKQALLANLKQVSQDAGVSLNAVLLGVLAASDLLPIPRASYEEAIRSGGIAVDANLKGLEVGVSYIFTADAARMPVEPALKRPAPPAPELLEARVANEFPAAAQEILCQGVRRLTEYQSTGYAMIYLDRLAAVRAAEQVAGGDGELTREVGRHLALRMSYEDVIRVAQLKCAGDRYQRIRNEIKAQPHEPVAVLDYFKPGIDELCAILPPFLAKPLLALSERRGWRNRAHLGLKLRSTTISGFLRLRLLAGLRRWRPRSYGYATAQKDVTAWLDDIKSACDRDLNLSLEIAECARLVKGYGDTFKHGAENYERIRAAIIVPALSGAIDAGRATDALANARVAALADPDGDRLSNLLTEIDRVA
ncbi:MAG: indolepyruvate oxidoreductase subunit beta family protein [Proteobacteria bacterium]|nr:indolepyruvate oxidoreductase subunit beta family protein [Pseudomonadota bacterium]